MPIFDFECRACAHRFETLVLGAARPACPSCGSEDLEKQLSVPGVVSDATKALSMKAAKKRDAAQARDRMHERIRYEQSHDRHG